MRTLIDIPEADIRKLDALAAMAQRSRAAEIREAIGSYVRDKADRSWIDRGAGY